MSQTRKAAKAAEARKLARAAAKSERQAQADAIAARNEDNAYHRAQSHTSHPSYKAAHANKVQDLGNGYTLTRTLQDYAYPRNGNTHNATPRYYWSLFLNGKRVDGDSRQRPLVAAARADEYR